jgi:nitrilase
MGSANIMRAAVAQFQVGVDIDRNLASCLRALDIAAKEKPDVVVLPEFCNHLSWYNDQDHCRRVSVDLDGAFLNAIAQKARDIGSYVAVNVTLNRSARIITATSVLFGPTGARLADHDKQVLIGHENDFLTKAQKVGPLTQTPFGLLGLYACMDGVINETPRGLALRGGRVLLNSLNSFARDEASLHIPVRAAENKVFIVAANKVGPLVPEDMVESISQATGIPVHFLDGAGESQIVAPDGTVLALAPAHGEAVVFAEFDPCTADDKMRPDGTHIFTARRPALYQPIGTDPETQTLAKFEGPKHVSAALIHAGSAQEALDLAERALAKGAKIIAVAPVCGLTCEALTAICPPTCFIAMRDDDGDSVLVDGSGEVLRQKPLHDTKRFGLSRADRFETCVTPYGRIALVAGDDGIFPEAFRLLAMMGAEIAIAPVSPLEPWELKTGLLERAAENRLNLLAPAAGPEMGFAASLQEEFTILTQWTSRPFDGLLSHPILTRATTPLTHVTLYPAAAANKLVSHKTDLLAGRPWALVEVILSD